MVPVGNSPSMGSWRAHGCRSYPTLQFTISATSCCRPYPRCQHGGKQYLGNATGLTHLSEPPSTTLARTTLGHYHVTLFYLYHSIHYCMLICILIFCLFPLKMSSGMECNWFPKWESAPRTSRYKAHGGRKGTQKKRGSASQVTFAIPLM